MFFKNRQPKDIGPIAFNGFNYVLPANSVVAVDKEFGEWLLSSVLTKVESTELDPKTGNPTGGIPPVLAVKETDWDGVTYPTVTRFQIDHARLPNRNDLIELGETRGVGADLIKKMRESQGEWPAEDIVKIINRLPVPESVRIPVRRETNDDAKN